MLTDEKLRVIRDVQAYGVFRQTGAPYADITMLLDHIDAQTERIAALEADNDRLAQRCRALVDAGDALASDAAQGLTLREAILAWNETR